MEGSVDASTAAALRQSLIDLFGQDCRRVEIDLAGVFFLDSTGLGVLVGCLKRYRSAKGDVLLSNPSRQVRHLLEVTGVDKVFGLQPG